MDDANQYIGAYSPSSGDETDRYRRRPRVTAGSQSDVVDGALDFQK